MMYESRHPHTDPKHERRRNGQGKASRRRVGNQVSRTGKKRKTKHERSDSREHIADRTVQRT
jgi:hypothetical protein